MSCILMNEWFVNQDKSITFFDKERHTELANGKSKQVPTTESKKKVDRKTGKVSYTPIMLTMYEHVLSGENPTPVKSTQITGYQTEFKSKKERRSITMLMPFGRRQMENKKPLQTEEDIEVLFGYREAPPAPEVPVSEEVTTSPTEVTTVEEVTQIEATSS
jgi:hypothetical protein